MLDSQSESMDKIIDEIRDSIREEFQEKFDDLSAKVDYLLDNLPASSYQRRREDCKYREDYIPESREYRHNECREQGDSPPHDRWDNPDYWRDNDRHYGMRNSGNSKSDMEEICRSLAKQGLRDAQNRSPNRH